MPQSSEDSDVQHYLFSRLDWLGESPPAGTWGAHRSARLTASVLLSLSGITVLPAGQRWDPLCFSVCVYPRSVAKSCRTFCHLKDCSPPGSSVHGILLCPWSGLPFHSPGALPFSEMEPTSPALASGFFTTSHPIGSSWEPSREIPVQLSWILQVSDPCLGLDLHQDSPMDCSVMPTWTTRFGKPVLPRHGLQAPLLCSIPAWRTAWFRFSSCLLTFLFLWDLWR